MKYGDACGEIDLAEFRTYAPDRALPTLHYEDDGTAGPKTTWDCLVNRPEDFHIHALEWTTTTMTFAYDGIVSSATRGSRPS